jgi:hypothetical protein
MKALLVRTHVVSLAVMVLVALGACRRSRDLNGVSETKFVAVMAALKQVRDRPGLDSVHRKASRDSILQKEGLTPAELEAAAMKLAQNPARAQTVWQAVEQRANDTSVARPRGKPMAK